VIEKYGLQDKIPRRVWKFLERGVAGLESETVKAHDPRLARSRQLVVGSIRTALEGAREKALSMGIPVETGSETLRGEARAAASFLAAEAARIQSKLAPGHKVCLLYGGETTVSVHGSGHGGRNQELALAFALAVAGRPGIELLSAGTDGIDGPTDAAGAIVDGSTAARAAGLGLDAAAFLDDNDSYSFFNEFDRRSGDRHHLKTGPSGTNVMDLQVILLRGSA
jgi:glycerate-2-kinase